MDDNDWFFRLFTHEEITREDIMSALSTLYEDPMEIMKEEQ